MNIRIRSLSLLAGFVFAAALAGAGERSALKWLSFDQGMALATRTNKKILVDVYTDWCGWCKKMDALTYGDKGIADYLSRNFVLVKLDAESDRTLTYDGKTFTERELAGAFGVSGYPSTLFLKPTGEGITVYPGFADAKGFGVVLSFIAEDHYLTTEFDTYVASRNK